MLELLFHLADENDPCLVECTRAIAFQVEHCRDRQGKQKLAVVAPLEFQILSTLFGAEANLDAMRTVKRVCEVGVRVADAYRGHRGEDAALGACRNECVKYRPTLKAVRATVSGAENRFASKLAEAAAFQQGIAQINGDTKRLLAEYHKSEPMLRTMAESMVDQALQRAGRTAGSREKDGYVDAVLEKFRVPLEIARDINMRVTEAGFTPNKRRANWLHDMDIAGVLSGYCYEGGESVALVTSDNAIIKACEKAGWRANARTNEEYLTQLGLTL